MFLFCLNRDPKFINGELELKSLPLHVRQMFTLLEESDFRVDISSTELRKQLLLEAEASVG